MIRSFAIAGYGAFRGIALSVSIFSIMLVPMSPMALPAQAAEKEADQALKSDSENVISEPSGPEKIESAQSTSKGEKASKSADKKAAVVLDEASAKVYFKRWFDSFYPKLYYAKDPLEVKSFYTKHCRVSMEHQTDGERQITLSQLKNTYIGNPKITKIIFHPGGVACDVKVEGSIAVNKFKGYGYCLYRMSKEGAVWKIDSAASRGKYHGLGMQR